jgi:galactokinase
MCGELHETHRGFSSIDHTALGLGRVMLRLFVPGRNCLFGEHSDWAGGHRRANPALEKGYTIVCGTNQGIYADIEAHPSALVLSSVTPNETLIGPVTIPLQADALLSVAQEGGFWSYIAGVAYQMLQRYPIRGLVIHNHRTDLPVKKGLSSSAAVCVLTARAFNRVYGLGLTTRDEMELAYLGETTTPSRCGRMDQCCAFGSQPVLMTFDGDHLETQPLDVGEDVHLVIVDLNANKDTHKILEALNSAYPFAENENQRGLQTLFGPLNRETVLSAVQALKDGDLIQLGALMRAAQNNFDRCAAPICPQELSAPVLHRMLNYPAIQPYLWGGKGIGSQGDGSGQLLARSAAAQHTLIEILAQELNMPAVAITIHKTPALSRIDAKETRANL